MRGSQLRPVVVVAAIAVQVYFGHGCGRPAEPDMDQASLARDGDASADRSLPAASEPEYQLTLSVIGRRGTLESGLKKLGVPSELHPALIDALGAHLDLRRLSPGTGLSVARDRQGTIVFVACRPSLDRYVRATLASDGPPHVEQIPVPVRIDVESAGGLIESTVTQALSPFPDSVYLTLAFADIFQWDLDLFVDPRPKDRVRLVYESRYLGAPPADLPHFGDSGMEEGTYLGIGRVLAASYEGERARSTAYWVEQDGQGGSFYDEEGRSLRKTFLKSPLNYRRISSTFSKRRRHPITRKVVPHHGVDFAAPRGTPVVAAADGRVTSAGWQGALGRAVRIRHGSSYETVYGHLKGFARGIRRGGQVKQNQVIGYVGSTGRSTGPHLHYALHYRDRAINPMTFKNPPSEPLDASLFPLLERAKQDWTPVLRSIRLDTVETGIVQAPDPHDQLDRHDHAG